jgi:hypothetical protein
MRAEFKKHWHPSTKLNAIGSALDFTAVDPLPDNVTRDEIEEYCYTLNRLYGSYTEELVAETALSRREAQTWVLRNLVHEGADRLTFEAVGLYVWAIGRATEGDPLSRTVVSAYHDRARRKIDAAEATVKRTQPPPYPDDLFEEPTMLWVEGEVAERLARRLGPEEGYSGAIERLLNETVDALTPAELVEAYREREAEFVGVQTVRPDWDRDLPLSVHVPDPRGDPPAAVAGADVIRVDGTPYPFGIEERQTGTGTASMLTLFEAGAVDPATGAERLGRTLDRVEATLPELIDRAETAGASALAVGNDPVGAGAHLFVVAPAAATTDDITVVDRLVLDDRTLGVGRVTTLSPEAYAERTDGTTLLWATAEAGLDETRSLPSDPADRRERLPTAVLRTG